MYRIVNGKDTSVWHDLWAGNIPLFQQPEAKKLLRLPLEAKVSELLSNGKWNDRVLALPQSSLKERILNWWTTYFRKIMLCRLLAQRGSSRFNLLIELCPNQHGGTMVENCMGRMDYTQTLLPCMAGVFRFS